MDAQIKTNMPWVVYRCEKLRVRGPRPSQLPQEFMSGHLSPSEAMDEADRLARLDVAHSYLVGAA
jgi:hypothetical protein